MSMQQLTLWDDQISDKLVWQEVTSLKEKQNNLRKGIFQRYDLMKKEMEALKQEMESIRQAMGIVKACDHPVIQLQQASG